MPKVNLLLLRQKEVEDSIVADDPWAHSKPIQGVSRCHVAHCSLTGALSVWHLPGEEKLTSVSYDGVGNVSRQDVSTTTASIESPNVSNINVLEVSPSVHNDLIAVKKGLWYVVQFTNGKQKAVKYVAQVLAVSTDKESMTIQSYLSTSYKGDATKRCFKKYTGPAETVDKDQITDSLPKPVDLLSGGRVLFADTVKGVK